ncbi:oligosaccharide flippase family protein [Pantanalinema rosaneae CENA516]|uniref:oligosaccharide flippase family protein n=1 Tax=Pantanalinema rosaneae TaxID=1620701 RepID=UPI003D6FDED7
MDQSSRNALLSLAQALLTILTYFLVMRQVVLSLGIGALGLWSLTMSLVAFVRLMDLGLANIPARMVAAESGDALRQAQFVDSTAVAGLSMFALLGFASYYALRPILLGSIDPVKHVEALWLLLGIIAVLPLNCLALVHLGALDGVGRADIRALVAIVGLLIYAGLALLLVSHFGVLALIFAQSVQHALTFLVARLLLCRRITPLGVFPHHFSFSVLRQATSFAVRIQLSTLPMALFDPFCRLLIGRTLGLNLLGIYELASKYAATTRTLVQAYANPILPEFARLLAQDRKAARIQYAAGQANISSLGLLISMAQILALPLVSYMLLDGLDPAFIVVSTILSFAWGVTCIGLVPQLYARAAGRLRYAMVGQWLLLFLGAIFVPLAELLGDSLWVLVSPAFAIIIGHAVAFFGEVRYLNLNHFGNSEGYRVPAILFLLALVSSAVSIFWISQLNL